MADRIEPSKTGSGGWLAFASERAYSATLGVFSVGAASIHFAVSPDHFKEYALYGLFFAALGWFQVVWGAAYFARPSSGLAALGGAVNAAVVAIWIVSRTAGLPFGPTPGVPEPVGLADAVASELEGLLVAGTVMQIVGALAARGRASGRWLAIGGVVFAAVFLVSVLALAASGGLMPM